MHEPRPGATADAGLRRRHRRVAGVAVVVGGGATRAQPQLLGRDRDRRRPTARVPVWGVWDDELHRFGFSFGPRSRKARNLAANPQAVVAIDDTVECVSVEGHARLVDDEARTARWVASYLAKYEPLSPALDETFIRANLLFELVPERAFAVIEREDEFSSRATRWVF